MKYGVEALSLSLRAEVAQFGVHVALIDPTGVRTRFVESQLEASHCTLMMIRTVSSSAAMPTPRGR